jgi:hypothetical protein
LRIRSDGDAQERFNARRIFEMPYDNAARAQACGQFGAAMPAMPRKHKICG